MNQTSNEWDRTTKNTQPLMHITSERCSVALCSAAILFWDMKLRKYKRRMPLAHLQQSKYKHIIYSVKGTMMIFMMIMVN